MGGWDVSPWCCCCYLSSCCYACTMPLNYYLGMVDKMAKYKIIENSSPYIQTSQDGVNSSDHQRLRETIRKSYDISGDACWDYICVNYCTPYALVQERHQLKKPPNTVSSATGFLLPPNWMHSPEENST